MSQTVKCSCGKRFAIRDDQLGRPLRCPACGARRTAPPGPKSEAASAPSRPPGSRPSGPKALAAPLNSATPQGAKNLAAALDAGGGGRRPAASRPHRFGTLGCALPLGLFLLAMSDVAYCVAAAPAGTCVFFLAVAAALLAVSAWRMWGQWTTGRAVWSVCVLVVCVLIAGFGVLKVREEQDLSPEARYKLLAQLRVATKAREEQDLSAKFAPVVQALGDVSLRLPDARYAAAGLRPKVLPVVLRKKGAKKDAPTTPPQVAFDVYRILSDSLKAENAEEVQTVVLLDYDYSYWGSYQNVITGIDVGAAYVGTCRVTVVDRGSGQVVDRGVLDSPEKPPESGEMEWRGPQPTDDQIVKYIQGLPTRQGDVPTLPRPDEGKGTEPDRHD